MWTALTITAASLAATILCFLVLTAAHGSFKGIGRRVGQLEKVRFSARSMFFDFSRTLARTLVAIPPSQMTGTDEEHRSNEIQVVRFTFRDDLNQIKAAVPTITGYQRSAGNPWLEITVLSLPVKAISLISLAQMLTHWLLHSFFGLELFLYSQHWLVPLVIALSCGLTIPGKARWISRTAILALTLAATFQTITVMRLILSAH
jgi:hypothetical protein